MTERSAADSGPFLSLPDDPWKERETGGPFVSVLIATYEAKRERIGRLLESIASQPYGHIEVVIVDSSKLDYLAETTERYDWIRYFPSEPKGVSAGFNEAISHADGDIFAIVADDDYFLKKRLTRTVEAIENGADIVYGDVYDLEEGTGELKYRSAMQLEDPDTLWIRSFRFDGRNGNIPAATVTFREECVREYRFNEELAGGEDYHLWVRLFEEFEPAYVPEPLAVMRQHEESLSSDPDLMYSNRLKAIELLCEEYPELRQFKSERKRLERYDYARQLMLVGRTQEARRVFIELVTGSGSLRSAVMLALSYLPAGHERIIRSLDWLYARLT